MNFEQDYLMRMIMMVRHYIARMIRLKQEQKPKQALLLLERGYEHFFGLSIPILEQMSVDELLNWFEQSGKSTDDVMLGLLEFLEAHVELLLADEQTDKANDWRVKQMELLLCLYIDQQRDSLVDFVTQSERYIEELVHYHWTADGFERLMRYFEQRQSYAKAEDVLHLWADDELDDELDGELVETKTRSERLAVTGTQFYQRLLEKEDVDLFAGELSREEVIDSCKAWIAKNI